MEVDTNPPLGAKTELKYLDFPLQYSVLCKDLPSSFAGKTHALLCRSYLKGRDWFDFLWYVGRKVTINYKLLQAAIVQNGPWQSQNIEVNNKWVLDQLTVKINAIDWDDARNDVSKFLRPKDQKTLELWSQDFFLNQLEKLENYL